MFTTKFSTKTKCIICSCFIIILYVFFSHHDDDFDEKTWYEEDTENMSEPMSPYRSEVDVEEILNWKKYMSNINEDQKMYNSFLFGVNFTLVIVIQVHDRAFYLEQLLSSLQLANGITKCLIVFSQDYLNDEINTIIDKVAFTKFMRIIYPYNIQLHPIAYPGPDLKYCPKSMISCETNVRYRNPEVAQLKHHWWWTVSSVFDKLSITRNYTGNILFLEEDQYVIQDFIYVLMLIEKILPKHYPAYDMIALGTKFTKVTDYRFNDTLAVIEPWGLSQNIALVFNRTLWNVLRSHSDEFCNFNDCKWSNTLKYIGSRTRKGRFIVLSIKSSRVLRFEKCELSNDSFCHEVEKFLSVQAMIRTVQRSFFPQSLSYRVRNVKLKVKPLGGWNDVRDRELCSLYTSNIRIGL